MPQTTHVGNFLEMLAVERGVNETTRRIYRRILRALAVFLVSRAGNVGVPQSSAAWPIATRWSRRNVRIASRAFQKSTFSMV